MVFEMLLVQEGSPSVLVCIDAGILGITEQDLNVTLTVNEGSARKIPVTQFYEQL